MAAYGASRGFALLDNFWHFTWLHRLQMMARAGFYAVESGKISFRHDGHWYNDEERIENPRIALLFSQSIRRNPDGTWPEDATTGTGFPTVFYLTYAMYRDYFPLLALTTYKRLMEREAA